MIKNFDEWKEYDGFSYGSGRSEKIWLINEKTKDIGLFKFPKTKETGEYWAEKLACEIASLLKIPCANVEIGTYNKRIGSMSYLINKNDEKLIEGVWLINKYYPCYNTDKLYDYKNNEYYSLKMIFKSIEEYNIKNDFLKMLIFDYLIGNRDRHQNNWALLESQNKITLSPLYDNGSSLCCYVNIENIDSFFTDHQRFEALINTRSRSRIRIDEKNKKEPTHLEVLKYLNSNYYEQTIDFVEKIINLMNEVNINTLIDNYSENIISPKLKKLLKVYLKEKVLRIKNIYNL
ncbi:TPA: HipA domain-containing protein [Clostridioides difficile]|uniref:HipA domain-containing protein n=1 Tax=Clostridioides difficile TaxID=1496 RepID=UPI0009A93797|nr:HipA domain-containing protein [Clostridioides difficile]EGT4187241.1 protein kinase [Clostridioides difficile]EGT4216453.1 protein kinase [Clostridioides difficile]MCD8745622.1 HipA domain-containing protein [Clostridioides difficile]MDL0336287.1 HipA domain-containing protein [Clostridioides difficile]MDS6257317.1 HipA domain-containing protein [Clostridioides difficile]